MTPAPLSVPAFARLVDYTGLWALEPAAARSLWNRAAADDLAARVARYEPGRESALTLTGPAGHRVAVVRIGGLMMKGWSSFGGTSTVQLRRDIRRAAADPDVAAILLHVDSPGGTVAGTADLAADVRAAAAKKPTWAFVEDLAGSAAYWVASQAERVYANGPTALVGSIGTLAVVYDLSKAAEDAGVRTLVFRTGPLKGAGTEGDPVTDAQAAYFQGLVDDAQAAFDAGVKAGRRMTAQQLAAVRTGGMFGAAEAVRLGLVDGIRSIDQVVSELQSGPRPTTARRSTSTGGMAMDELNTAVPAIAGTNAGGAAAAAAAAAPADAAGDAAAWETARILAAHAPNLMDRAARERWTPARARKECLEVIHSSRPLPSVIAPSGHGMTTDDHIAAAIMVRSGHERAAERAYGARVMQQSRDSGFHTASLVELLGHAMQIRGLDVPRNPMRLLASGGLSGASASGLATILGDSAHRIAEAVWQQTAPTWRSFCAVRPAANFKEHTSVRPTFGGDLKHLPRGIDIEHGTIGEHTFNWKVHLFAKQYRLDYQDIVDDDLGLFGEIMPSMAMAAVRCLSDLVYATLLGGIGTFFQVGHDNTQTGGGSALQSSSLAKAVHQMRLQTDPDGNVLDITPAVLVVPPSLEMTARALLNSTELSRDTDVDQLPTGNPLQNVARLEVEPRLQTGVTSPIPPDTTYAGDLTAWFLFASPAAVPVVVGFLRGQETPRVEAFGLDADPDRLNMSFRVHQSFGAALGDYRAAQHSAGA